MTDAPTDATSSPTSARLAVNVWVRQQGYGPGFGDTVPPSEFWVELDADVWAEAPAWIDLAIDTQALADAIQAPVQHVEGDTTTIVTPKGQSVDAPAPATPPALDRLASLPNDKTILLTFADEEGIDVDGRKGPAKLRADIEQALAERAASNEALGAGDEAVSQAPTGEASVSS